MTSTSAPPAPYRIRCSSIWGGIEPVDLDVCTQGITASVYSTASGGERGGDIYYLSVCSIDKLTRIAIADVRGHGEQVGEISSWLYQCLQDKMNSLDGASVLGDLNGLVHQRGFEAITTAAVVSYYIGDCMLYYSYAGHPPAIARRSGGHWLPLPIDAPPAGPANLPLGILPRVHYDQCHVELNSGDRFFLYTDGLSESPGADPDDLFGDQRLLRALEDTRDADLAHVKKSMLHQITSFAGGTLQHDDCTLMIFEVS